MHHSMMLSEAMDKSHSRCKGHTCVAAVPKARLCSRAGSISLSLCISSLGKQIARLAVDSRAGDNSACDAAESSRPSQEKVQQADAVLTVDNA